MTGDTTKGKNTSVRSSKDLRAAKAWASPKAVANATARTVKRRLLHSAASVAPSHSTPHADVPRCQRAPHNGQQRCRAEQRQHGEGRPQTGPLVGTVWSVPGNGVSTRRGGQAPLVAAVINDPIPCLMRFSCLDAVLGGCGAYRSGLATIK